MKVRTVDLMRKSKSRNRGTVPSPAACPERGTKRSENDWSTTSSEEDAPYGFSRSEAAGEATGSEVRGWTGLNSLAHKANNHSKEAFESQNAGYDGECKELEVELPSAQIDGISQAMKLKTLVMKKGKKLWFAGDAPLNTELSNSWHHDRNWLLSMRDRKQVFLPLLGSLPTGVALEKVRSRPCSSCLWK